MRENGIFLVPYNTHLSVVHPHWLYLAARHTIMRLDIYNLIQKQPSCKIKCAAPKNAAVKKDVKSKVTVKKWL